MGTGNNIKKERERQYISQQDLAKKTNINVSVLNRIENETRALRDDELLKIANFFNVTTDYLLGNETPAKFKPQLTDKDKKDIAKQVEDMLDGLDADNPISFQLDGNEIDDDTRELLRQSLQNALEFARLKAKEKFTPKKYRK